MDNQVDCSAANEFVGNSHVVPIVPVSSANDFVGCFRFERVTGPTLGRGEVACSNEADDRVQVPPTFLFGYKVRLIYF